MKRVRSKGQEGFALIVVILLVVVMAVMGLSLLQLIRLDLSLVGYSRRNFQAKEIVYGGAEEFIAYARPRHGPDLPQFDPTLTTWNGWDASTSVFTQDSGDYRAIVNYIRFRTVSESSQAQTLGVVYEYDILGGLSEGGPIDSTSALATAELRVEAMQILVRPPNYIPPMHHHR